MSAIQPIDRARTALLFVDPYNDFLAPEGKLWPMVASVATELRLLNNLRKVVAAPRGTGLPVIIVPHHRWKDGDLDGWNHPNPYLLGGYQHKVFEAGSWGGEWFPDFAPQPSDLVATEHWRSSGFANTNLDFLLKQKGISCVIMIGLIANTCIESTGRYAWGWATASHVKITSVRVPAQTLLYLQRQRIHPTAHVGDPARQPNTHIRRNRDHEHRQGAAKAFSTLTANAGSTSPCIRTHVPPASVTSSGAGTAGTGGS